MKITLLFIQLMYISSVYSQEKTDTIFYNSDWKKINVKESAKYYRIANKTDEGFKFVDYYIEGGIQCTGMTTTLDSDYKVGYFKYYDNLGNIESEGAFNSNQKNGLWKTYNKDGKLRWEIYYSNGKLDGQLISYHANGKQKRSDIYRMDSLIVGECFSIDGEKIDYYPFEQMPEYIGGDDALMQYIVDNVKYPKEARKKEIEGIVMINFTVNTDGSIGNVRVVKSIHPLLDEEAVRVVKQIPNWVAGKQDGEPVPVFFDVPIAFKLE